MSGPDRTSARDLERLSAYLDGQLPPGETAGLEARLRQDEALGQTLEGLRQTRAALRSLPTLRPPRNFTLTPQMAGVRPRRPAYPALRLATAIATVAFLLVSGVDVLIRGLGRFGFGAAAPAMLQAPAELEGAPVMEEAAPADRALEATTSPPSLQAFAEDALAPTPTAQPLGAGGGLPPEGTAPVGMGGGEPLATAPSGAAFPPSKTPTPTGTPTPSPTPTLIPAPSPSPELGVAEPRASARFGLGAIQWVELFLGAAVVVFAAFSLWFRREA
jgi:hypothetical protein